MKPKTEELIEAVELNVRAVLDGLAMRFIGVEEKTYLECVLEGIELVTDPLKERLREVQDE